MSIRSSKSPNSLEKDEWFGRYKGNEPVAPEHKADATMPFYKDAVVVPAPGKSPGKSPEKVVTSTITCASPQPEKSKRRRRVLRLPDFKRPPQNAEESFDVRDNAIHVICEVCANIVTVTEVLLEKLIETHNVLSLDRDPLLHFCIVQMVYWSKELSFRTKSRTVTYEDCRTAIIGLINLDFLTIRKSQLVALRFASSINVFVVRATTELIRSGETEPPEKIVPTLSNFNILHCLGAGGFGSVYKATFGEQCLKCTIKIVRNVNYPRTEHALADKVVASITDHPLVVSYYCTFQVDSASVTVMEYVKGLDLQRVVDRTKCLPVPEFQAVSAQICAALQHLHFKGILHRDIKGSNCLVTSGGKIRLIDYDTSRLGQGHFANKYIRHFVQRTPIEYVDQEKAGTPPYMAPEVISMSPKGYGRAADNWSMGVTFFKIFFGFLPFVGKTENEVKYAVTSLKPRLPSKFNSPTERAAVDLIVKLLSKDAQQRLGSSDPTEIICHPLFKGLEWSMFYEEEVVKLQGYGLLMAELAGTDFSGDLYQYSPKATPRTMLRPLAKPETFKGKRGSLDPLMTYVSPFFRSVIKKTPLTNRPIQSMIEDVHTDPLRGLPDSTCDLSRNDAESFDVLLLPSVSKLGIELQQTRDQVGNIYFVVSCLEPAITENSHLLEGDIVLGIGGCSLINGNMEKATNLLKMSHGPLFITVMTSNIFRICRTKIDCVGVIFSIDAKVITVRVTELCTSCYSFSKKRPLSKFGFAIRFCPFYAMNEKKHRVAKIISAVHPNVKDDIYVGDVVIAIAGHSTSKMTEQALQELLSNSPDSIQISIRPHSPLRINRRRTDRLLNTYKDETPHR